MSKKKQSSTSKLTVYPSISQEAATKAFIQSIAVPESGSKSNLHKFVAVAEGVLKTMKTFGFSDMLYQSRPYDIPPDEVRALFARWVEKMTQLHKIEAVNGVYDDPVYIVV